MTEADGWPRFSAACPRDRARRGLPGAAGQSVDEYVTLFGQHANRLSEQLPDFPAAVSGRWAMSAALLTPDAGYLVNLCAFFSPEPIAAELLLRPAVAVDDPPGLGESCGPRAGSVRRPANCTGCHWSRSTAPLTISGCPVSPGHHEGSAQAEPGRVVPCLPGSRGYPARRIQPGPSGPGQQDPVYDLSWPHIQSERNFLYTANPALRRLIIDQVRRLHLGGWKAEAMQFGQDALKVWRERLGPDDLHVLTLAVEVAAAMRVLGSAARHESCPERRSAC